MHWRLVRAGSLLRTACSKSAASARTCVAPMLAAMLLVVWAARSRPTQSPLACAARMLRMVCC